MGPIKMVKDKLVDSWGFWKWSNIKKRIKTDGPALAIIFIVWEIIEDVLLPGIAIWLGDAFHPFFYSLAPIAWIACFHWLAVPIIFGVYKMITKKKVVHSVCAHK